MTTVFDPVVILFREISCQSLLGVLRLFQLCCMKNWYYYRYLAEFKISNMTIVRKTKFVYLYNQLSTTKHLIKPYRTAEAKDTRVSIPYNSPSKIIQQANKTYLWKMIKLCMFWFVKQLICDTSIITLLIEKGEKLSQLLKKSTDNLQGFPKVFEVNGCIGHVNHNPRCRVKCKKAWQGSGCLNLTCRCSKNAFFKVSFLPNLKENRNGISWIYSTGKWWEQICSAA